MNERRYASGEVPQVGDVVRYIGDSFPPFQHGRITTVVRLDSFGDPITEIDKSHDFPCYANSFSLVSRAPVTSDGSGVFHVEEAKTDQKPEPDFVCPHCGGRYFGRQTAKTVDGEIVLLESVWCNDQREVGCRWRGVWPMGKGSRKIDLEIAELRRQLEERARERDEALDNAAALRDVFANRLSFCRTSGNSFFSATYATEADAAAAYIKACNAFSQFHPPGRMMSRFRAELNRQVNEAWMRLDYATADRIADLLGVPRPTDHEAEDAAR